MLIAPRSGRPASTGRCENRRRSAARCVSRFRTGAKRLGKPGHSRSFVAGRTGAWFIVGPCQVRIRSATPRPRALLLFLTAYGRLDASIKWFGFERGLLRGSILRHSPSYLVRTLLRFGGVRTFARRSETTPTGVDATRDQPPPNRGDLARLPLSWPSQRVDRCRQIVVRGDFGSGVDFRNAIYTLPTPTFLSSYVAARIVLA